MSSEKSLIRKKYKIIRNKILADSKKELDQKIINSLIKFLTQNSYHTKKIAIFFPIGSEINLLELYDTNINLTLLFPRIASNLLIFKEVTNKPDNFEYNHKYKIYEPGLSYITAIPEIIICPLLAFDLNKNRLGYGGGFYDRTVTLLKEANHITYIGVAYNILQSEKIPSSNQDHQLDFIITEDKLI